jgi:hypothetical protein
MDSHHPESLLYPEVTHFTTSSLTVGMRVRPTFSPLDLSLSFNDSLPLGDREAKGFSLLASIRPMQLRLGLSFCLSLGDDETENLALLASVRATARLGLRLRLVSSRLEGRVISMSLTGGNWRCQHSNAESGQDGDGELHLGREVRLDKQVS